MTPKDRATFVAAYSRLVAEVWADPETEAELDTRPAELLATFGLTLPDGVRLVVVRDVADAEPSLDTQVDQWFNAEVTGTFTLVVPRISAVETTELAEHELDAVVAGLDASCACCCPCCCT
ncbi:hypothetical protein O7621_02165 [Solwaraspora sp. WMMD937]|uniref:hypothetical protein n=1 Tax=Solwaraspora sp. WMMD937 TaxID=3016090 RepID=UPI00249B3EA3|nr:hypothetical protein [Solwaraspora sp. WMMD937]WFE22198.1 hypothetical protein O7621_02165 [Solwaraspora sp. WMMD937]